MSEVCEHKYVHLRSDGYYKSYRYSNTFYLHDFYFCEKCLTEKQIDKSESVSIYSPEEIPDWARHITKKVNCEMSVLKITKYLNFTELPSTGKTKIMGVGNNSGEKLGIIKWSGGWRKYCYFTLNGLEVQYDAGCLQDIIDFIKQLMEDRK